MNKICDSPKAEKGNRNDNSTSDYALNFPISQCFEFYNVPKICNDIELSVCKSVILWLHDGVFFSPGNENKDTTCEG